MKVHIIISNYKDYTSEGQGINSVYFSYKKAGYGEKEFK